MAPPIRECVYPVISVILRQRLERPSSPKVAERELDG